MGKLMILLYFIRVPCRRDGKPAAHPRGATGLQEVASWRHRGKDMD